MTASVALSCSDPYPQSHGQRQLCAASVVAGPRRAGAEVRFHKTSRILADLAGGHADRTFDKRLATHVKADLLILDDFAMREFTPGQADDLYELISQRIAESRSIALTANRAPQDWYPLFPNPVVAESLLDRLINNSHQVFMNGPSYRRTNDPR